MENSKLTLINIRGTSGSGKSYIIHNILKHGTWKKWVFENKVLGYYNEDIRWFVVGSYENTCGGCDGIKTQDEVQEHIKQWVDAGYNVIFEGLLISTLSSRWINLAQELSNRVNTLFYYLSTPLEECISRVVKRRQLKGNFREFNAENTSKRVQAINATFKKITNAGLYTMIGSQEEIMRNLKIWFNLGGN